MSLRDWKPKIQRVFGKETETLERGLYRADLSSNYSKPKEVKKIGTVWEPEKIALSYLKGEPPNLIGSELEPGNSPFSSHAPVIDLDVRCRLVESATPDHYHLYIDHPISKVNYLAILSALEEAGLLQEGFRRQLEEHGQTFVRWGVLKGQEDNA